ncbi:testis-expressed protein 15 [Tenrec ecaudatus]|uniref:testis-expressed protein 15 n=1 Tax=Tenrec ecaudatus TaxID=94439 RepID=UPI003F593512
MEMKETAKHKQTPGEMDSTSETLSITGLEVNPLKKFTIPKIRKKANKAYLSPCFTNTREYSFIHAALNQCRLDVNYDLQSSWQFGDTKLIHNEDLEKQFSAKRSEMRENGRHGRELEEHFCFLAIPRNELLEIYQNGLNTSTSTLKILGNPLLGIYVFRYVDVALNYAHSRSITVDSIVIFKVIFGKVKKIQLSLDKNKVSLDPSPNFDCHMSRSAPSLKDSIDYQAYGSAVYFYEYSIFSKPVDKPRQCLPYAIITVKFIGQKVDNLMTSLRFLSTGFPKRGERACSLNNCTVAKRIGKGKDAPVIFEHFRKPGDPFTQESCSCCAPNAKTNPCNSHSSNSCANGITGNFSILETHTGQTKYKLAEHSDTCPERAHDSGLISMPSDTTESGNSDLLLNLTQAKNILSGLTTSFPIYNNTGSSTVITSKLIKDPRMTRREASQENQNNKTGLNDNLAVEKHLESGTSAINSSSMSTNSVSSSELSPDGHTVHANCLDASCRRIPSDDSQSQVLSMYPKDYDHSTHNKITTTGQCTGQGNFPLPVSLSQGVPKAKNQNHNEDDIQRRQQRTSQTSKPLSLYKAANSCATDDKSHVSKESESSSLVTACQPNYQMSSFQNKDIIDKYIENMGNLKTDPEGNSKPGKKQSFWKDIDHYFTNEAKTSSMDNYISYQEHTESDNLDSSRKNCDRILITQELEISVSSTCTRDNAYELKDLAMDLQNRLMPSVESLLQNHQHSLEYDNIHTSFVLSEKQVELNKEKPNQNYVGLIPDALQEAEDIFQASDKVISSRGTETAQNNFSGNLSKEHLWVREKNENELVSLEDKQKDYKEIPRSKDKSPNDPLLCERQLNKDMPPNTALKEQKCESAANDKDVASSPQDNRESIYGAGQQVFHTNKMAINAGEKRENKSHSTVEILTSEERSTTFSRTWGKKYLPAETTLIRSEAPVSSLKQEDAHNHGKSLEHLASTVLLEVPGSLARTSMPQEDHQRCPCQEPCSSETSNLGVLLKPVLSDCETEGNASISRDPFLQSGVNENLIVQGLDLESEIEIETEQYEDAILSEQDAYTHGGVLSDELQASYKDLKSRIDWEALLESRSHETEALETPRRENTNQHYSENTNYYYYSPVRNTRGERLDPILLPDLQIRIPNIFRPRFSPTADSRALRENFYSHPSDAAVPEINEREQVPGLEISSQSSGDSSDCPPDNKLGNIIQESGLMTNCEASSPSLDVSQDARVNHMSGNQSNEAVCMESSSSAVNSGNSCWFAQPKADCEDARRENPVGSGIGKRKLHAVLGDQKLPQEDLACRNMDEKKRKLLTENSPEGFWSLSQGQMTFSQSGMHIRNALDILKFKASLCKIKCLSRKVDRTVLHLEKAHRRVHTSLEITKVGEKRSPLPKSCAVLCNNLGERCDLEGCFSSKGNDDTESKGRASDVGPSFSHGPGPKSCNRNGELLSKKNVAGTRGEDFGDQEHLPASQLCLLPTSQSTSQTASTASSVGFPALSERQPFPGKTRYFSAPEHLGVKLPERESHTEKNLSNIHNSEKIESHSSNMRSIIKQISPEADEMAKARSVVPLRCMKESERVHGVQSCDATPVARRAVNTDGLTAVLEASAKDVFSGALCKPCNVLSDCQRTRRGNCPVETRATALESPEANHFTGHCAVDAFKPPVVARTECESIAQLGPAAPGTGVEGCDRQRGSWARSQQQESGGNGVLKKERCSSANPPVGGSDPAKPSVDLLSATGEGSADGAFGKRLLSSDRARLGTDPGRGSSSKESAGGRTRRPASQAESNGKRSIGNAYPKESKPDEPSSKTEYRSAKILEDSPYGRGRAVRNNPAGAQLRLQNASSPKGPSVNKAGPPPPNKRERGKKATVDQGPRSPCTGRPEAARQSQPGSAGMPRLPSCPRPPRRGPTGHRPRAPIAALSHILQRAHEAPSLQRLQEQAKACQNILPSFIEAFQRDQGCAIEDILISRELLVTRSLWTSCRSTLKPGAVESLVELQMMMETLQFVENKRRLLEDKPTFRSLLWFDETLYSELLAGPRGYQQQASFYPAFQGRLKYNAFCELQKYHGQLVGLFEETKREANSYYAFLKYKRQIQECEAIMKHCPDCFDFMLSVPFTCGVNLGDSLGDLETLRKRTLALISAHDDLPKAHSCPGKLDHLWIIIEMIASKVHFIKNNEAISVKRALYGLEHIFFDAMKKLVWEERRRSSNQKYSRKKYKEMLLKINQEAFSKLQDIYDTLSKDFSSKRTSSIGPEKATVIACKKPDSLISKAAISIERHRFNNPSLSHPNICFVSEILDQAESADVKTLQELTLRCTNHLEIFKKHFQILQEDDMANIFITEENALDMVKNDSCEAVILKPQAIETYIEILMVLETVHFLKNSIAQKLDKQRFRGMLWFDLSLLPDVIHCQEKMACFSFLKDNSTDGLGKVIDTVISELRKDLGIICKFNEAVNCSYALHLFSRELKELSEVKKLVKTSQCSLSTYVDFMPFAASVNYGNTASELERNYSRVSALLKNVMAAPQRDVGKVAHVMKVMKTIEHMKMICAKDAKLATSFILCQMLYNRKKTLQLQKNGKMSIHVSKHEKDINQPRTYVKKAPSISQCTIKTMSNSSAKRPLIVDTHEDLDEQEKNSTLSSCKKQKVDISDITKINEELAALENPRTTRSGPQPENKIRPSASGHLKRKHALPPEAEMPGPPPTSLAPFKALKDACTANLESRIDVTHSSSHVSEDFAGQQKNWEKSMASGATGEENEKAGASFGMCDQNRVDGTFSQAHEMPSKTFHKISPDGAQNSWPANTRPGTGSASLPTTSGLPKPVLHLVKDTATNLGVKATALEPHSNEMLAVSTESATCTSSSAPALTQSKVPLLQANEAQPESTAPEETPTQGASSPSAVSGGASANTTLNVNPSAGYAPPEQRRSGNSKPPTQNTAVHWNEPPPSACTSTYNSEHSFGASHPYYTWRVCHHSSISGSSIMQTSQGMASYEAPTVPLGMLTAVASTVQNAYSNLFYSQNHGAFAESPQAAISVPVNGYFQFQMPVSYSVPQPSFPPTAAYPCPPAPALRPGGPWVYGEFHECVGLLPGGFAF